MMLLLVVVVLLPLVPLVVASPLVANSPTIITATSSSSINSCLGGSRFCKGRRFRLLLLLLLVGDVVARVLQVPTILTAV